MPWFGWLAVGLASWFGVAVAGGLALGRLFAGMSRLGGARSRRVIKLPEQAPVGRARQPGLPAAAGGQLTSARR